MAAGDGVIKDNGDGGVQSDGDGAAKDSGNACAECCEADTCTEISQVNITFDGVDVTVCDECRDPSPVGPDFKITSLSLDGSYGVPFESGTCTFNCPRSGATLTQVVYDETDGTCATVDETCTNVYLYITIEMSDTESGPRVTHIVAGIICADDACTVTKFPATGGAIEVFEWNGSAESGADNLANQKAACGTAGFGGPGADGGTAEVWWGGSPADVTAIAGDPNACQYDYGADDCGVCDEGDPFDPPAADCP